MDPMDFTMDHPVSPLQQDAAPRCPYMHGQALPQLNTFVPPPRDAHRYDPVHNTDSWHQSTARAQMSSHAPASSMSHWTSPSTSHNWQSYGELHTSAPRPDLPDVRSQGGYMGTSSTWGDLRNFSSLPFGQSTTLTGANGSGSAGDYPPGRNSAPASASSAAPRASLHLEDLPMPSFLNEFQRRMRPINATHPANDAPRPQDRSPREPLGSVAVNTESMTSSRPSIRAAPRSDSYQPPRRRRTANTTTHGDTLLNSDEDEDSGSEVEMEAYRRNSELHMHSDESRERYLAIARARLATGRRVPSKDALASLEKVARSDLSQEDNICSICYNEFGVENPEGLVEQPLRLPHCKHIFGDSCIKKWFEQKDSCPYCRDKLPSELTVTSRTATLEALRLRSQHLTPAQRTRLSLAARIPPAEDFNQFMNDSRFDVDDTYNRLMNSTNILMPYSGSSPTRVANESAESRRRRQRRPENNRFAMHSGRPASVGFSRSLASPLYQGGSQRTYSQGSPPNSHWGSSTTIGDSFSPGSNSIIARGRDPSHSELPSASPASPAVAVGSNITSHSRRSPTSGLNSRWSAPFGSLRQPGIHHSTSFEREDPADRSQGRAFGFGQGTTSPRLLNMSQSPFTAFATPGSLHSYQSTAYPDHGNLPSRWSP